MSAAALRSHGAPAPSIISPRRHAAVQQALDDRRLVGAVVLAGISDGMAASGISLQENLRRLAGAPPLYAPGSSWGYSLAEGQTVPALDNTAGFGLGFSVVRDPAQAASPESAGAWRWGGAHGHSWFVDRARGLSVVAFTNTLCEGMSGGLVTDLRDAVYAEREDAQ
ncbi:Esterase estB [Bordetella ansorpii]|uniref:Esterase estB n=1 Tax=Bordetella ansorpii TaxID=288768 RepID=A0A157STJ2_9BORD|nr:Esterase estB [Bordetella ansorpii]